MSKYLAKLKALREKSASHGHCQNCQNLEKPGFDSFDSTHGSSLSRLESPLTEAVEPNTTGCAHEHERAPETLDLARARRDRFEERAAIWESDEGLPRAEAARREMAGVYDDIQAECDPGACASALAVLRANCPAYVPEDRWRQAVADAMAFTSEWGEQAQALGWTARVLFGPHIPPERPLASYRRLARCDETGLIWLLRGRPVIALTETVAAIQGATAVLTYRKLDKPALGPLGDSLDDIGAAT